jgi:hypothetical protein
MRKSNVLQLAALFYHSYIQSVFITHKLRVRSGGSNYSPCINVRFGSLTKFDMCYNVKVSAIMRIEP